MLTAMRIARACMALRLYKQTTARLPIVHRSTGAHRWMDAASSFSNGGLKAISNEIDNALRQAPCPAWKKTAFCFLKSQDRKECPPRSIRRLLSSGYALPGYA